MVKVIVEPRSIFSGFSDLSKLESPFTDIDLSSNPAYLKVRNRLDRVSPRVVKSRLEESTNIRSLNKIKNMMKV